MSNELIAALLAILIIIGILCNAKDVIHDINYLTEVEGEKSENETDQ